MKHSLLATAALLALASPAAAQVDLSGEWAPRFYEDQPERVPGPELGDYLGIPISDAARWRAQAWDASIMTLPEWQCRPHSADYIWRGPSQLTVSRDIDPISRDVTSFDFEWLRSVKRSVYLDGRPHPSENAPHTWAGFATAEWRGDMLAVHTTHLKEGYVRRNGLPRSDKATLSEYLIRNDGILTVVAIVHDPVYLTEPFIRSTDYELDLKQHVPPYPCHVVEEIDRPNGQVPHLPPDSDVSVREFAALRHVPVEAARGGAATMYPAGLKVTPDMGSKGASDRPGVPVDLTGQWVSVVTEDWRWRMVVPPKGDYTSIPLNPEGVKVAEAWDPAADAAGDGRCRPYGAGGVMRMPGQVRISWRDDQTLRVETEAGGQTRLFAFAPAAEPSQPSLQGVSKANWILAGRPARDETPKAGELKVTTTGLAPGYLRRNGVPYSADATVTEYYNRIDDVTGESWLVVTTVIEDPRYLDRRFFTSSHFKKVVDGSPWTPRPCQG